MLISKRVIQSILAAVSVSLVLVTLGAAFGVLSGRGAVVGMISAVIIALIAAIFNGTKFGVSSPTGPMTAAIVVILAMDRSDLVANNVSDVEFLSLVLICSAVFMGLFILTRIYKLLRLIPNLVIAGFVNGIAALIVLAQLKSVSSNQDLYVMLAVFGVSVLLGFGIRRFGHVAWKLLGSSLLVIVVSSLIVNLLGLDVEYLQVGQSVGGIDFSPPRLDLLNWESLKFVVPVAFELALIALLDTLLTSVIIDDKSKKKSNLPKELFGQSVALFTLGIVGGIPGAQSTVPSVMLWQEGGSKRWCKFLVAVFCAMFVLVFIDLLQFVPLAVFGGVILKIAYDVADFTVFKTLIYDWHDHGVGGWVIVLGTIISTVAISLNMAVVGFTVLFIVWNQLVPRRFRLNDLCFEKETEGFIDEV